MTITTLSLNPPTPSERAPTKRLADRRYGAVRGGVAVILRLESLAVLVATILVYFWAGGGFGQFAALFLTPDIGMAGYLLNRRVGAASYNFTHTYTVALLMEGISIWFDWRQGELMALIWVAHIAFDRLLGYGLKYPLGFTATHLS